MTGVPLVAYLALGLLLFTLGVVGVIVRRNPIVVFMSIELMLNAVNLTFLAFARYLPATGMKTTRDLAHGAMAGQMAVILVMAVAAAEVAVGLGIIMAIFRLRDDLDIDEMNLLKG
ncbi:MAG: NADH-quinone oxidoreductase subunit NuoK [Fimbriimonas ginsengisoli]|uniref:NADH-quinone oxidoreductase subunit K n=1 Tax=Fimbriimonas ginsengisoli TaxID=1005039 RepID=A0A931PT63_FIMGI|nr:NADH-quinone oxidoreductase subunit NuoK [Fimbriimonas ginsengisoli]